MKTLVLFHSFTGKTKALAAKKAEELGADIEEILDKKRPSKFFAFTVGGYRAIRRKQTPIQPLRSQLGSYDKIILMSPVWGSRPTPAINSAIEQLPPSKKIELIMVSGGGTTGKAADGTKALIYRRGCEITEYTDVKG